MELLDDLRHAEFNIFSCALVCVSLYECDRNPIEQDPEETEVVMLSCGVQISRDVGCKDTTEEIAA